MAAGRPDRLRRDDSLDEARAGAGPPDASGPESTTGAGAAVARLQATAGNRAVAMILREPGFQLRLPWLLGGEQPRPRPGDDLRLDPDKMAEAEAEIAAKLAAESLLAQIRRVRLGMPPPGIGEPGGPDVISGADPRATSPGPPAATAPTPPVPAPKAPPAPPFTQAKPGEASDLMDAITAHPSVAAGMAKVREEALRAFRAAPAGQKRLAIVSVLAFSALAVGGAVATPGGREMLGRLSGKVLPVPEVDWLGVEFNSQGDDHILGVHVDVGGLLPKSWGFGPAGPGQGPAPMTPSATGPGNF